ncbi:MAG: NYN domain-containing protein [Candidatus Moranbacteria bacterium]|nr:NYN domain-containing protein [Candidatus Moranbacteria bacterium]
MAKFSEQRVGVLVDIQNMYYTARVLYGKKVNFKNILEEAVSERKLIRAVAYGVQTEEGMEAPFFEALENAGYEVKKKDLQIFAGGIKKADWDVGIAMDAVRFSKSMDVIVLVSGDGDYLPLVEYIQNTSGCRVEMLAFKESSSAKLIERVDEFFDLSAEKEKFLLSRSAL